MILNGQRFRLKIKDILNSKGHYVSVSGSAFSKTNVLEEMKTPKRPIYGQIHGYISQDFSGIE